MKSLCLNVFIIECLEYKRIKTTENTDISMEMHLMKYPKLQNFYQIKRLKENSN